MRKPVTPEAAGSSPVDPANYPSENKGVAAQGGSFLASWPEFADWASLQAGGIDPTSASIPQARLGGVSRKWWMVSRAEGAFPRPPARMTGETRSFVSWPAPFAWRSVRPRRVHQAQDHAAIQRRVGGLLFEVAPEPLRGRLRSAKSFFQCLRGLTRAWFSPEDTAAVLRVPLKRKCLALAIWVMEKLLAYARWSCN
jgi:hypothetical protein